jgi:hypothetical protein
VCTGDFFQGAPEIFPAILGKPSGLIPDDRDSYLGANRSPANDHALSLEALS